jgi:uncharacterized protein YchJ
MLHERAVTPVSLAYQTLGDILRDTDAPASVQFKAARFIVERGTAPTPPAKPTPETAQLSTKRTKMHKTSDPPSPKPAQPQTCPCGSGKTSEDCCRNNPLPGAA